MLEEKILNTISKYNLIKSGDNILVAVSGGPDSICLLNILNNLKEELDIGISVVHINHGFRKEAIDDEEYVKEYCNEKEIKIYLENVDVKGYAKENKKTLEEAGRELRYDVFNKIAKKGSLNKIAIAHNENDNAETILMNLLRGSSLKGLKGITPVRIVTEGRITKPCVIRPLIETSREEIEEYCKENKLNPRHDKSNDSNIYTRNKIRNEIIPYIKKELNPNIIKTLSRLAIVVRDEEDFMQQEIQKVYKQIVLDTGTISSDPSNRKQVHTKITIDVKKFNTLHISIKRRLILYIIEKILGSIKNIEKVHVDEIIELLSSNVGNKYKTPNKNIKVYVNKSKAEFINLNIYNKTNL